MRDEAETAVAVTLSFDTTEPVRAPTLRALPVLPPDPAPEPKRRGCTENVKRLAKSTLARDATRYPPAINAACPRPATYGACEQVGLGTADNPCPYVSCKHNLFLDVNERSGSVLYNHGTLDLHAGLAAGAIPATCALREADRGGLTLEEVAARVNLTRERVRQVETRALHRLRANARAMGMEGVADWITDGAAHPDARYPSSDPYPTGDEVARAVRALGVPTHERSNGSLFAGAKK